MSLIEFAMQSSTGRNRSNEIMRKYHKLLNRIFLFNEDMTGYFRNLEEFSIIFRISGEYHDFDGGDGPEYLKKVRGKPVYTIDFTVPVSGWKDKSDDELRKYFAEGIRQCFELLKDKAKKAKEIIDEEKLNKDFNEGMKKILTLELPDLNR